METFTFDAMETEIEPALPGSASGVAKICTVAGDGGKAGAVKIPSGEIVPHVPPEHPAPEALQEITRLGLEIMGSVSVAEKAALVPAVTEGGPVTLRLNELVMVIGAVADLDGSATLAAVSETAGGVGRICGAV
jgi:hypothetical protein